MKLAWVCTQCGTIYARTDAGPAYSDLSYYAPKSGCCSECLPRGYQDPGMTSFDHSLPPQRELLDLCLEGEINLFLQRNPECQLLLFSPLSDSPVSTSS